MATILAWIGANAPTLAICAFTMTAIAISLFTFDRHLEARDAQSRALLGAARRANEESARKLTLALEVLNAADENLDGDRDTDPCPPPQSGVVIRLPGRT